MADSATAVAARPPAAALLDKKMHPSHAIISGGVVLIALVIGVWFIATHISQDFSGVALGSAGPYVLLVIALLIALGFEFVNGFHDTANAVATVIYTHSLEPNIAVVWSGMCNLAGVLTSSGLVAFTVITLLPVELILQVSSGAGFAMVFALLIAAILWNLSTWWFGLPASSSHTMVGSIIGVGLANQLMNVHSGTSGVDWEQATKVFKVLLISPIVGFGAAALLFLLAKATIKYPGLYEAPKGNTPPPWPIRALARPHLHRRELLPRFQRRAKGHGTDHADPDRHGAHRLCVEPRGNTGRRAAIHRGIQQCGQSSRRACGQDRLTWRRCARNGDRLHPHQASCSRIRSSRLRELVEDLSHEVGLYKEFKAVPANQQTNVRNDMYVASEAIRLMQKKQGPSIHRTGECDPHRLQRQG